MVMTSLLLPWQDQNDVCTSTILTHPELADYFRTILKPARLELTSIRIAEISGHQGSIPGSQI